MFTATVQALTALVLKLKVTAGTGNHHMGLQKRLCSSSVLKVLQAINPHIYIYINPNMDRPSGAVYCLGEITA